ncbi:Ig-like domain-containing protein [Pseudothermotoga sp.]|nr:hypothetical protein [Pseudothermotoga sp.]MDW8139704.1 hypothetical protein [Pseudothermotoga sp.]
MVLKRQLILLSVVVSVLAILSACLATAPTPSGPTPPATPTIPATPTWQDIPDRVTGKGLSVTVNLADYLNDPDKVVETIVLKEGPGSVSNGVYSWTPDSKGTFNITIAARTKAGQEITKSFRVIVKPSGTFTIYVTQFNSGPAVLGATVIVKDDSGNVRGFGSTDADGKASFLVRLDSAQELLNVFISKPTHAKTVIFGVRLQEDQTFELTTTLRKAAYAETKTEIPISVNVKIYTNASKTTEIDPNNVTQDTIYVSVTATPIEFNEGINTIYAKVGGVPGTSFFTAPRLISYSSSLEGLLSVKEFDGLVPLIVDVYDHNDNKVEKIVWLNVVRNAVSVNPYLVERISSRPPIQPDLIAYTKNGASEFYSKPPIEKFNIPRQPLKFEDFEFAPMASPDDKTNLWIEVRWLPHASSTQFSSTTPPKAYKIYRSFDGTNFVPIATVDSSRNFFRDSSPLLSVGKETWYAVASVYDGYEATKTVIGSVTPLPMFQIEYIGPLNGATNVSRDPTFAWRFKGLEAYVPPANDTTRSLEYFWDIWLYDLTVNTAGRYRLVNIINGIPYYYFFVPATPANPNPTVQVKFSDYYIEKNPNTYWVDFAADSPYPFDKLQANKTYSWGNELLVARLLYNGLSLADQNKRFLAVAYAVHTDYAPIFNPFRVEPAIYHTFTTGSN